MKKITIVLLACMILLSACAAASFDESDLIARSNNYISSLSKGKAEEVQSDFEYGLAKNYNAEELADTWGQLVAERGDFVEIKDSYCQITGYRAVIYTLISCEKGNARVMIAYTDKLEIETLSIQLANNDNPYA